MDDVQEVVQVPPEAAGARALAGARRQLADAVGGSREARRALLRALMEGGVIAERKGQPWPGRG